MKSQQRPWQTKRTFAFVLNLSWFFVHDAVSISSWSCFIWSENLLHHKQQKYETCVEQYTCSEFVMYTTGKSYAPNFTRRAVYESAPSTGCSENLHSNGRSAIYQEKATLTFAFAGSTNFQKVQFMEQYAKLQSSKERHASNKLVGLPHPPRNYAVDHHTSCAYLFFECGKI